MTTAVAFPDKPDTSALVAQSNELVIRAKDLTITNAETYAMACEFGKAIKALRKEIDKRDDPNIKKWFDGHRSAVADKKKDYAPTLEAEAIIKRKIDEWNTAQRIREEKEQREREAAARKISEDRQLQDAIDLEEDGDLAGAVAILDEPPPPPLIPLAPPPQRVSGVVQTKRWTFDLEKFEAVVCHIAGVEKLAHPELLNMLTLDTAATRQLATGMKEKWNVPGIRVYQTSGVSLGSK